MLFRSLLAHHVVVQRFSVYARRCAGLQSRDTKRHFTQALRELDRWRIPPAAAGLFGVADENAATQESAYRQHYRRREELFALTGRDAADAPVVDDQVIDRRLEDLQARFGIAEHLGAFGTFLIERTARSPVWSVGAFRLFGSDSNGIEPTLREFTEAIPPQDRRLWIDLHRKAMREGGEAKLEYRFLRDGGEPIWIRSIARAETGRAGRIERLAGVAQDITSMRAMRQQLAESEAKFRDLTNMSSDWVWETDLDYRWSFFSDGAEALFGQIGRAHV